MASRSRIMSRHHIVTELLDKTIRGSYAGQVKRAQRSLYAWSFKCHREDEYDSQQVTDAPIYACRFGEGPKYGHILVSANEDGQIALMDTRFPCARAKVEGHQVHQNAIFDVCWIPRASELVSASGDQKAVVMAVRADSSLVAVLPLLGHTRAVKTVHVNPFDCCVIATGARDGSVIIWDTRCKPHHKADEIAPAHQSRISKSTPSPSVRKVPVGGSVANNSVIGVLFQQQHTLISAGASDGLIKFWDLRKTHGSGRRDPQCQSFLEHSGQSSCKGFTSLSLSPSRDVLYTSCMDNVIYAYHLANPTPHPVAEYTGHTNSTYFVKSCISPCGSYLLSGSSDDSAYIWLTDHPGKPIAKLTGHFAEVTSVAWGPIDEEKLVTCADDMKLRIFRRKNINMDDFDEKMNISGMSEPYIQEYDTEGTGKTKAEAETKEGRVSESLEPLPPLPVTPSTSGIRGFLVSTPSNAKRREGVCNSHAFQTLPKTPQQQTPQTKHAARGRVTPCTPKTGEKSTLLHWLASAKTPRSHRSPNTPGAAVVSDSKKASLKRKLTDLIDEDQENVRLEVKAKSPDSPQKNILCTSTIPNTLEFFHPSAAKMLKYGDDAGPSKPRECQEIEGGVMDMADSMKPIEANDKDALGIGFRKPVTNISAKWSEKNMKKDSSILHPTDSQVSVQTATLTKQFHFGNLTSPTANLPNYVIDGLSPHNRPETKLAVNQPVDWLTTFGHQRKLKFTRVPDKSMKRSSQLGSTNTKRHGKRKVLQIEKKRNYSTPQRRKCSK